MRRILLCVLAGVALLSATVVLLNAATASVSQPVMRVSAQLVSVAPSGLTAGPPARLARRRSGLKQTLAHLLATDALFANPATRRPVSRGRARAITVPSPLSQGMACPVATGSRPGGCSIVPCAVYVGGQTSYTVTPVPGLGLAVLPRVTPRPSPGGRTPAGTCVSRPGRPPQTRWVSSANR